MRKKHRVRDRKRCKLGRITRRTTPVSVTVNFIRNLSRSFSRESQAPYVSNKVYQVLEALNKESVLQKHPKTQEVHMDCPKKPDDNHKGPASTTKDADEKDQMLETLKNIN